MAGAVGNYGPGPAYGFPDDVIHTVGSVNSSDQLSSITPRGSALDLVAPGENVDVTWYYNGIHADLPSTGTSWTAPQVTGTAALIKQINPRFSSDQVYQIIRDSATWVYDSYSNASYPRLNVNAALGLAYQRSGSAHAAPVTAAVTSKSTAAPTPAAKPVKTVAAAPTPAAVSADGSFRGVPFATGTLISAADYNTGGEGVSYHDLTGVNEGNDGYRTGAVGTAWSASQNNEIVGWTQKSEWMNYTINVAKAGTYAFFARTASVGAGGRFHVEVDGRKATSSIAVPNTGGWDTYTTQMIKGLKLKAGNHVVRIVMDKDGTSGNVGNFAGFSIAPTSAASWLIAKVKAVVTRKKK
jgi:hypothetical protein